jgi:hypothetical protein
LVGEVGLDARERIDTIDILRGLAIMGILFVNIHDFSFPSGFSKFHSMFSFLFGLGAAVQMNGAENRGEPFAPRYCRRLLVLLAISIVVPLVVTPGGGATQPNSTSRPKRAARRTRPRTRRRRSDRSSARPSSCSGATGISIRSRTGWASCRRC